MIDRTADYDRLVSISVNSKYDDWMKKTIGIIDTAKHKVCENLGLNPEWFRFYDPVILKRKPKPRDEFGRYFSKILDSHLAMCRILNERSVVPIFSERATKKFDGLDYYSVLYHEVGESVFVLTRRYCGEKTPRVLGQLVGEWAGVIGAEGMFDIDELLIFDVFGIKRSYTYYPFIEKQMVSVRKRLGKENEAVFYRQAMFHNYKKGMKRELKRILKSLG